MTTSCKSLALSYHSLFLRTKVSTYFPNRNTQKRIIKRIIKFSMSKKSTAAGQLTQDPSRNIPGNSHGSDRQSIDGYDFKDPVSLDEEYALEEGQADNEGTLPKRTYAVGGRRYNDLKTYNGQAYSGMAIGGSHTWNYDPGVWKETKEEPDLWRIDYQTNKRRARNAPKGSGAPVGTEYHWLIVGHQVRDIPPAHRWTVNEQPTARAQNRCQYL